MTDLTAVAVETILNDGGYRHSNGVLGSAAGSVPERVNLREAIDAAVAGTTLLREKDLSLLVAARATPRPDAKRAHIRCVEDRSGRCAQDALTRGARRVGVLNYANGVTPGGGFLTGSRAQEEALCRMSGLYACLGNGRAAVRAFYDENAAAGSTLVTGHILTSPAVPFFRDEELRLLDAPFPVTVLTAAAPNLRRPEMAEKHRAEIPGIFAHRCRFVFAAAVAAGCDAVVVGPRGCGAFRNDPGVVAEAFYAAVAVYGDAFDEIVFSTFGPEENRRPFLRRFAP